jgi:hypothetical protein
MNKWIDNQLHNQRSRLYIRIAMYVIIILSAAMAYCIYYASASISHQNQCIRQWGALRNSCARENLSLNDSLVDFSRMQTDRGLFHGWNSVASWLENIRANAIASKVAISYELEPVQRLTQLDEKYSVLSVKFNAIPKDGKFQTVMKFIEAICQDSSASISMTKLEIIGNDNQLTSVAFRLAGCLKL